MKKALAILLAVSFMLVNMPVLVMAANGDRFHLHNDECFHGEMSLSVGELDKLIQQFLASGGIVEHYYVESDEELIFLESMLSNGIVAIGDPVGIQPFGLMCSVFGHSWSSGAVTSFYVVHVGRNGVSHTNCYMTIYTYYVCTRGTCNTGESRSTTMSYVGC